ncbi:M48 family metalloprotease [Kordiimonas sp. SCSIO 12610]|uniref:M48 family metalloprotease n=1 Tax=Kordiimonas sp. SCSIO 12610 TaxID=2829597 RepID=UPI00210DBAC6|nr:M48 family metalloprotease [Kordiimonas sp. SCSIO 12610]UTW53843.1 M48 family metallopeptidase [Kordiimonas sp. SCSIO 12610]
MKYTPRKFLYSILAILVFVLPSHAQSLLRDAETEAFFRDVSDPIFEAAGLTPASVNMYLLGDQSLNAFVTGGQNIFIHSGLMLASDDVNQLIGVIAHETGHIAGGHLVRNSDYATASTATALTSLVLGAAAILAGSPDAGIGIISAGQSVAQRQYLAYNRVQESSADIAGIQYLEAAGVSGRGLIQFFDKLRDQEILAQIRQDPYVRSHPLNRQRILSLQEGVSKSPYFRAPPNKKHNEQFNRIKAKLAGYLYGPQRTLRLYPLSDQSQSARYARVYAYHKALEWDLAMREVDSLLREEPENPYYYEIKGQILFEQGKVKEAVPVFERAAHYSNNQPLIMTALGQALVSLEDNALMERAIPILEDATRKDRGNAFAWFNLAKAYSWLEKTPEASLATAERFYAVGGAGQAAYHASQAVKGLKQGTPEWLRAQDILVFAEQAIERQKGRRRRR